MNFKNILIVMFLSSLLLLTACGGGTPAQTISQAYIGGTSGIGVIFEPFSIQEEGVYTVFDSEDFPIEVSVTNGGEETIGPGDLELTLLGPAKDSFINIPMWELSNTETIEKKSEFNPEGGEEIISFTPNSLAKYVEEVIGYTDVSWNLNYEYKYATHLIINDVCFKGDLRDERVCNVKESKSYSVSGAPITVTSVEEDTAGRGIVILKIGISNAQTGESTKIGEDFDDRFSKVAYTIDEPEKWGCSSGGRDNEARLIDGKAEIICRLATPLATEDLYTQPVQLTIDYVYQDLIVDILRVKQSAE
jgi:hypothetical protein